MAEDMIAVTRREIERWPGVAVTFANGGKHITATLAYGDKTRMVVCAKTPSDNGRGVKNHVAEVRRALLSLGAVDLAVAIRAAPIVSRKTGEILDYDYDSISFAKMSESERAEYIDGVSDLLSRRLGVDVDTLRREAEQRAA
jgi:hypothetical protein